MISFENRLLADDSHELLFLISFQIRKDVAKFVVCCSRDWRFNYFLHLSGGNNDSPVKAITTLYKEIASTRYTATTDTLAEHNTTFSVTETVAMASNSTDIQTTKTSVLLATNRSVHGSETTYSTLTWLENQDRFSLPRISERSTY